MEMSSLVYVVSHGEASDQQLLAGRSLDSPLSDRGREQAERLAKQLTGHRIVAVYSSPQLCAIQTAKQIAQVNGSGLWLRQSLSAVNYGDWAGHSWSDIIRRDRDAYTDYCRHPATFCYPAGESIDDAQRRSFALLNHLGHQHAGSTTAMVVNKQISQALVAKCSGVPLHRMSELEQRDGCVNVLKHIDGGWQVRAVNVATVSMS